MMLKKKKITIIIVSIILPILIIGIMLFLYIKTDLLKSSEMLFSKYFIQNFDSCLDRLELKDSLKINQLIDNNKYTSTINGKIEYIQNIGTSAKNKNSKINDIELKINSSVDKSDDYNYRNVLIGTRNQDLLGFEYLNQGNIDGIRLKGVKQFVSINDDFDKIDINLIDKLANGIDLEKIIKFTEEEKSNLTKQYTEIIRKSISKEKYQRKSNVLITINDKDVQTNSYSMKLTTEEYNNLIIKILEKTTKNEIILSKIDIFEETIKEYYKQYESEKTLRQQFIDMINEKIEKISDNNIGNEEIKITVYENKMKTVRTSIETSIKKITMDLYNNSVIKISEVELGEYTNEQILKIENNQDGSNSNFSIAYEKIVNNEVELNFELTNNQIILENNEINKIFQLEITNQSYSTILNIEDNINIVEKFEKQITLEEDYINLDNLPKENVKLIEAAMSQNIENQVKDFNNVINYIEYLKMLQNLKILKEDSILIPENSTVTELEKTRFNSQFEFFVSENLNSSNIKELLETAKNNFENMKILLKDGTIEDLDIEKIDSTQEGKKYNENIDEILILLKRNSNNENKKQDVLDYIEKNPNNKYKIILEYGENGLAQIVRIKIQ